MATNDNIDEVIEHGIVFGKAKKTDNGGKVKTKARKKKYVTGAHHTAASHQKKKIRADRARRLKHHGRWE